MSSPRKAPTRSAPNTKMKAKSKTKAKAESKTRTRAQPTKGRAVVSKAAPKVTVVPFSKKNQQPTEAEFAARLPVAIGKKFESVRATLRKQRDVSEVLYFFGPKTGWAYRYLLAGHSVATVMIHSERLVGIVALDEATLASVDFTALSEVARQARRTAHGTPKLSWLDIPLDASGAADFKVLVRAKLRSLVSSSTPSAPPPTPPPAKSRSPKASPPSRPPNGRPGGVSAWKR